MKSRPEMFLMGQTKTIKITRSQQGKGIALLKTLVHLIAMSRHRSAIGKIQ